MRAQPIFLAPLIDWPLSTFDRGLISSTFFAGCAAPQRAAPTRPTRPSHHIGSRLTVTAHLACRYFVGVVAWAWISDRRGRRPTVLLSLLVGNVAGTASFLAPSYAVFLTLRFACGFGIAGAKNGVFLLGTEFAAPSDRAKAGLLPIIDPLPDSLTDVPIRPS